MIIDALYFTEICIHVYNDTIFATQTTFDYSSTMTEVFSAIVVSFFENQQTHMAAQPVDEQLKEKLLFKHFLP